jgi:hypothetical protein
VGLPALSELSSNGQIFQGRNEFREQHRLVVVGSGGDHADLCAPIPFSKKRR